MPRLKAIPKNRLFTLFIFIFLVLSAEAQFLEIPFTLKNDIILIEVKVNDDKKSRTFVFDTGATSDVLDIPIAKELGLKSNYKQDVPGAGGITTVDIVLNQKLILNNTLELPNANLVLVDLSRLQRKLERNFDGILGYSLLRRYTTQIDYDNRKILLYKNISEVNTEGYTKIPFKFSNGIPIPQFDLSITLNSGENFSGNVLFDSGAALTLAVNTPFNNKYKLDKKAGKSLISQTENLNTSSVSKEIAIKSLTIGNYKLDDMVISLANDTYGVSSYKGYLGILGAKVISRFNAILDYANLVLYIRPSNNFPKPFEFPTSGITILKEKNNIVISYVQEESEAYAKGVRKGDIIISINGITTKDVETYRNLLKRESGQCELVLKNEKGQTETINITLKRLL